MLEWMGQRMVMVGRQMWMPVLKTQSTAGKQSVLEWVGRCMVMVGMVYACSEDLKDIR